jgi:hypothetical protein
VRRDVLIDLLGLGLWSGFRPTLASSHESSANSPFPAPDYNRAISRGLAWLAGQQLPDGAWNTAAWGESTGVTGLALLAFLSAGHQPDAGPFHEPLTRGLAWILSHQQPDGQLVNNPHSEGPMFEHGICTLLLSQLLGIGPLPEAAPVRRSLERAVRWIIKTQTEKGQAWHPGGWARHPMAGGNSDLGVSVWQLMALAGARQLGMDVPESVLLRGRDFVHRCWNDQQGGFGFEPNSGATTPMTAAGIVSLEVSGETGAREAVIGRSWLNSHRWNPESIYFYYGSYFYSLAEHIESRDDNRELRTPLQKLLLSLQEADGQWLPRYDRECQAGSVYSTSLAVGSLSLALRLLPIYELPVPASIAPTSFQSREEAASEQQAK